MRGELRIIKQGKKLDLLKNDEKGTFEVCFHLTDYAIFTTTDNEIANAYMLGYTEAMNIMKHNKAAE